VTAPADLELVRRILEETGVEQTPPVPGWSAYFEALAEAFGGWLVRHFPRLEGLASLPRRLGPAVAVLGAALVVFILIVVVRTALRQRRLSALEKPPAPAPAAPRAAERGRREWRHELEWRLASGDVEAALEALWWWFARSVSGGRVDPSWTSRDLLASSDRADLLPIAGVLDRLLYGFERPDADDVRRFLVRLEAALP